MLKFTTALTLFLAVAASAAAVPGADTAASDGVGEGGLRGSLVVCESINGKKFRSIYGDPKWCNGLLVEGPPFEVVKSSVPAGCEVDVAGLMKVGSGETLTCVMAVGLLCKGSSETK